MVAAEKTDFPKARVTRLAPQLLVSRIGSTAAAMISAKRWPPHCGYFLA